MFVWATTNTQMIAGKKMLTKFKTVLTSPQSIYFVRIRETEILF